MMQVNPILDWILVKEIEQLPSGRIVVQGRPFDLERAEVVRTGGGLRSPYMKELMPVQVKPGDVVMYIHGSGISVHGEINGKKQRLMREGDICAIVEGEDGDGAGSKTD